MLFSIYINFIANKEISFLLICCLIIYDAFDINFTIFIPIVALITSSKMNLLFKLIFFSEFNLKHLQWLKIAKYLNKFYIMKKFILKFTFKRSVRNFKNKIY